MIKPNNQNGFTIVELLMAMVFFSFILVFATASYIQINRSFVRGSNVKLVQEETRKVISEISSALKEGGSSGITVIDEDDANVCTPGGEPVNPPNYIDPIPAPQCRHRICVGDTAFAWNQAVLVPDESEHGWYQYDNTSTWLAYHPLNGSEPFSVVRTGASADCSANVAFLDSTAMVDGNRIMVQDIDVYPINPAVPDTYMVRVSLSTRDDDPGDNEDLNYQSLPSDSQGAGVQEYKAQECFIDSGSQEFCYVETLSTIVTIR